MLERNQFYEVGIMRMGDPMIHCKEFTSPLEKDMYVREKAREGWNGTVYLVTDHGERSLVRYERKVVLQFHKQA